MHLKGSFSRSGGLQAGIDSVEVSSCNERGIG